MASWSSSPLSQRRTRASPRCRRAARPQEHAAPEDGGGEVGPQARGLEAQPLGMRDVVGIHAGQVGGARLAGGGVERFHQPAGRRPRHAQALVLRDQASRISPLPSVDPSSTATTSWS